MKLFVHIFSEYRTKCVTKCTCNPLARPFARKFIISNNISFTEFSFLIDQDIADICDTGLSNTVINHCDMHLFRCCFTIILYPQHFDLSQQIYIHKAKEKRAYTGGIFITPKVQIHVVHTNVCFYSFMYLYLYISALSTLYSLTIYTT